MGGVGGHMMHLYDNPLLTFSEMREIFDLAAAGALKGTEKTDGQNLFISYSIKDGKAKAARNKSNIKAGGLTATELAEKFAGRGSLEKTFVESFEAFERVAQRLRPEQQENIFGPDTNIYYSAEVLDPRSVNVISYDTKSLVIHRSASEFDRNTGNPTDRDVSGNITFLSDALENEQENMAEDDYGVQLDAIQDLQEFLDQEFLQETQSRLTDLLKEQSISDDQTILDFMISKIKKTLYNEYNLTENISREVLKYIITSNSIIKDKYNISRRASKNNIVKLAQNPEEAKNATEAMNNTKEIMSDSLMGLEDIVHDFSVEAVKGLRSLFILDDKQEKEMLRLRRETERAITAIENSGNEEAMFILQKQMKKLKSLENINTASEGFVFDYDGSTYKFTGNFAPMNQLLGLFKYGRGSVPPLEKLDEFSINDDPGYTMPQKKKDLVVVYPGRFQPMGKHHAAAFSGLQREFGENNVYVVSSNVVSPPKSPFNFEEKKKIIMAHGIPEDRIIQARNPYAPVELLSSLSPDTVVLFAVGDKDMRESPRFRVGLKKNGEPSYFRHYRNNIDNLESYEKHGYLTVLPHQSLDVEGYGEMSGTTLRKVLAGADKQTFENIMGFFNEEIYNLMKEKLVSEVRESFSLPFLDALVEEVLNEVHSEKQRRWACSQMEEPRELTKAQAKEMCYSKDLEEEEELEEMSSMGAGSVEGYSGSTKKKKPQSIIRQ